MTWIGDIIFGRFVHQRLAEIGDFSSSFWNIHPHLTWADLTIANLECSLSDTIPQPDEPHTFSFTTVTAAVEGLKLAEIDVVSRANNHALNFGTAGMDDTTAVLDAAGIKHFGAGHNLDEARRAVVVEKNGVTYAFLGYNGISDDYDGAGPDYAGTMPLETDYVVQDIERELAAGHVVIPYFHWGIEYVADPSEEQRYFAQLAIDHGASLVMGSHPHWVQAVETYRGKAIVYSLGNFIFDQDWSVETTQGMIAHIWMKGGDVLSIDLVPIVIEDEHRPRVMSPQEAVPVLNRVWEASERIITNG
jgi:poly-gamma-glutamate synthesis protein (capsule biosynthesis protein)